VKKSREEKPWRKAVKKSREEKPWRKAVKKSREEKPWRKAMKKKRVFLSVTSCLCSMFSHYRCPLTCVSILSPVLFSLSICLVSGSCRIFSGLSLFPSLVLCHPLCIVFSLCLSYLYFFYISNCLHSISFMSPLTHPFSLFLCVILYVLVIFLLLSFICYDYLVSINYHPSWFSSVSASLFPLPYLYRHSIIFLVSKKVS